MKMMWLMMTITHFSEKRKKEKKRKNRKEIRAPESGGGEEIRVSGQNIY